MYTTLVQIGEERCTGSDRCDDSYPSFRHFRMQTGGVRASGNMSHDAPRTGFESRFIDVHTERTCLLYKRDQRFDATGPVNLWDALVNKASRDDIDDLAVLLLPRKSLRPRSALKQRGR